MKYIGAAKHLNFRQAPWSLFFTCFDFQIIYRSAAENKANALSCSVLPSVESPTEPQSILPPIQVVRTFSPDPTSSFSKAQRQLWET